MPLQSSGAISLANIQSVHGGANPVSMSEYYKNGSYVPSTKQVVEGPSYAGAAPLYYFSYDTTDVIKVYWNGALVYNATVGGASGITSRTAGGATYTRGSQQSTGGGYMAPTVYYHQVTKTSTQTINASVPTSGVLSISNFYGTE